MLHQTLDLLRGLGIMLLVVAGIFLSYFALYLGARVVALGFRHAFKPTKENTNGL